MNLSIASIATTLVWATCADVAAQVNVASAYTSISGKACKKQIDDMSTGAFTLDCAGIGGFRLLAFSDDERSSISLVTPDKRIFPLNYGAAISPGFLSLGTKAEWRFVKRDGKAVPFAIIVKVNILDQTDLDRPKRVPYFAVTKITNEMACVTAVIDATSSNANGLARMHADDSSRQCKLKTPPPPENPKHERISHG